MTKTITLPRSVLEQALEALEMTGVPSPLVFLSDEIKLWQTVQVELRAALEQPQVEQEPVAVVTGFYGGFPTIRPLEPATVLPAGMALYANPQPPRQPLTKEEIAVIKLAREAGFSFNDGIVIGGVSDLERFAALVAAAEREACARIAERAGFRSNGTPAYEHIAEAIRARSST